MSQSKPQKERRQYPRLKGNIPVKICSSDFDAVTETKNLSRSGAYCRINKYIEPMTKLSLQLLLPFKRNAKIVTKKVSCGGVVVRTESVPGEDCFNVAIYFNDIKAKDAECITDFVHSTLNQ